MDRFGAGWPLSKLRDTVGVASFTMWWFDRCTLLNKEEGYRLDSLFVSFVRDFFPDA
jgi:hypothetical protein